MPIYLREGTWYVDIIHPNGRIRRSTRTTVEAEAQRFHDELRASLWERDSRPNGKTWYDAATAWLNAKPRSESETATLAAIGYENRPLSECTVDSFEKAIGNKSPATFNRISTIYNAILNTALKRGWVDSIKVIPKRKEPKVGYRFLSKEEWERLYIVLPEHLKAPAEFSISTGLRQANTLGLRWDKVDIPKRIAWVRPEETKAGNYIGIPLSDQTIKVLRSQVGKHDQWVFPYKGRGRVAGSPMKNIKGAWQRALERAELGHAVVTKDAAGKTHRKWHGDFRWHDFRHTFASWHVMSGTPLEVLQKLGGWSSIRMVQKYAHLHAGHVAKFANNAKPWSQKAAQGEALALDLED